MQKPEFRNILDTYLDFKDQTVQDLEDVDEKKWLDAHHKNPLSLGDATK